MPLYRTAEFTVKPEGLAEAKNAIAEYVAFVNEKERGTRLFLSLQSEENPHRFLHVMAFDDAAAETKHQATEHRRQFEQELDALVDGIVRVTPVAPIGMDAPGKTRRSVRKVAKKPQRKAAAKKLAQRAKQKR